MREWQRVSCIHLLLRWLGYLLGSIPFGLLLTRARRQGRHPRRSARATSARPTCCAPGSKGAGRGDPAARHRQGRAGGAARASAVSPTRRGARRGRARWSAICFPVWLRFRGGKGVATCSASLCAAAGRSALVYAVSGSAAAGASGSPRSPGWPRRSARRSPPRSLGVRAAVPDAARHRAAGACGSTAPTSPACSAGDRAERRASASEPDADELSPASGCCARPTSGRSATAS